MGTRGRSCIAVIMAFCCCLLFASPGMEVSAAEEAYSAANASEFTDANESADRLIMPRRGTYLQGGTCELINEGNSKVSVTGETEAYQKVDFIEISLYLERFVDGDWIEIKAESNSATNSSNVSKSYTETVTPGYYYRASARHHILEGSMTETGYTYTRGVMITN